MILLKLGIVSLAVSVAVGEWIRQYRVKRDRKWRSKEGNGTTGAELARSILSAKRIDDVEVVESRHFLTNHFLPEEKVVRLAPENFHGKTIAALGMAAHVVGHALQAEEGHRPLRWRNEAIRFTVWGSAAAVMG
ncbi:MAG: zinc metallopeptidase, partial [Verrucomicrobiota bacterium]